MKIKSIDIENFLSFQKAYINLEDYPGLTVIKGKNLESQGSNGSGKSSIVEAIYFGLTGNTIRKSTVDTLVNNVAGSKCRVMIALEANGLDYTIVRGKKPTLLRVFQGKKEITKDHVRNTQAYLDELLKLNHNTLLASMFFGQANDTNFLDSTADEKRNIIKNFLGLDSIFDMRERIRGYKSEYSSRRKFHEKSIEKSRKRVESLGKELDEVTHSTPAPSMTLEECEALWTKYHKDNEEYGLLRVKENDLKMHIRSLESDNVDKCSACGQALPKKEDCSEKLHQLDHELKYTQRQQHNYLVSVKPLYTVAELAKLIDTSRVDVIRQQIEDLESDIAESSILEQDAKLNYEVMRYWEKALSEDGIIRFVIRNVIGFFNNQCNYYLNYLTNQNYSLEFDDKLNEKITIGNSEVAYISLSGGEKRKVNLAVMLGLKDLLMFTDNNHPDIIFFDEVAENIDENGIEGLYNLLLEIKNTKQVFVITHNKHLKTLLDSAPRITVEKKDGISTIWHK